MAGCSVGIANAPSGDGMTRLTDWKVIPPGGMSRTYFSISDSLGANSVISACLGLTLHADSAVLTHLVLYTSMHR